MKTCTCIILCCMLFSAFLSFAGENKKKVLVFPYKNEGSIEYDYLSNLIPTYLFVLFKDIPGYTAIPLYEVKRFMKAGGMTNRDLENQAKREMIIRHFNTDYIIKGQYRNSEDEILTDIYAYAKDTKDDFSSINKAKINIPIIHTLDELFIPIIEKFTKKEMHSAIVSIKTDNTCSVIIDGYESGQSPSLFRLYAGKHNIKLVYRETGAENIIYNQNFEITAGEDIEISIKVFINLTISSGEPCIVLLNNKTLGTTPFETRILSGKKYLLELVYRENEKSRHIFKDFIISEDSRDIILDFPSLSSIAIGSSTFPLSVCLNNGDAFPIPKKYASLSPGEYEIHVFLSDPYWKTEWTFYKGKVPLQPFQKIDIDASTFSYKFNVGICLLPSRAQFYNKQPGKGKIVRTSFLCSALLSGITTIIWGIRYWEYINGMKDRYTIGYGSGFTDQEKLEQELILSYGSGVIIGGLTLTGCIYMYSFLDGIITMGHLSRLITGKQ